MFEMATIERYCFILLFNALRWDQGEDCAIYDAITPLRCLLLADDKEELFVKLEHHNEHRKRIGMWEVSL